MIMTIETPHCEIEMTEVRRLIPGYILSVRTLAEEYEPQLNDQ